MFEQPKRTVKLNYLESVLNKSGLSFTRSEKIVMDDFPVCKVHEIERQSENMREVITRAM